MRLFHWERTRFSFYCKRKWVTVSFCWICYLYVYKRGVFFHKVLWGQIGKDRQMTEIWQVCLNRLVKDTAISFSGLELVGFIWTFYKTLQHFKWCFKLNKFKIRVTESSQHEIKRHWRLILESKHKHLLFP